jgi:bifunctional N-acetylglutamate synthase/kinase
MRAEIPRLFWRAREQNAINEFYFANAEGSLRGGGWIVFWYGLEDWAVVRSAVEHARSRPATLQMDGEGR